MMKVSSQTPDPITPKNRKLVRQLITSLMQRKDAKAYSFLPPDEDLPNDLEQPICLKMIEQNLAVERYPTVEHVFLDIHLLVDNAPIMFRGNEKVIKQADSLRKAALRLFKKYKFAITPKMALQEEEVKSSEVAEISKETAEKGPEEEEEQGVTLDFALAGPLPEPEPEKDRLWAGEEEEQEKREMFYNIDAEMVQMYSKAENMLVPYDEKKLFQEMVVSLPSTCLTKIVEIIQKEQPDIMQEVGGNLEFEIDELQKHTFELLKLEMKEVGRDLAPN